MVGLAVAGRAGWALVFTRLPVAAWAPTSPHYPTSAPPRPSAKIISWDAFGFVRGTSVTPGVENPEPGGVRRSRRRRRVMIEQV